MNYHKSEKYFTIFSTTFKVFFGFMKRKFSFLFRIQRVSVNVPPLGEVAKFGTFYFLLKIKILAKRKREFTTKFAILPNGCYQQYLFCI
jgi:hypothetical protein